MAPLFTVGTPVRSFVLVVGSGSDSSLQPSLLDMSGNSSIPLIRSRLPLALQSRQNQPGSSQDNSLAVSHNAQQASHLARSLSLNNVGKSKNNGSVKVELARTAKRKNPESSASGNNANSVNPPSKRPNNVDEKESTVEKACVSHSDIDLCLKNELDKLHKQNFDLRRKIGMFQQLFRDRNKLDIVLKLLDNKALTARGAVGA